MKGNISVQPAGDLDLVDDDVPVQQNDNGGGDPHGEDQGVHGAPANTQLEHSGQNDDQDDGQNGLPESGELDVAEHLAGAILVLRVGGVADVVLTSLLDEVLHIEDHQNDAGSSGGQRQDGSSPSGGAQEGGG